MKKNNIYWGMIFIIMAALIVVNGLGLIEGVGVWSIIFTVLFGAALLDGIVRLQATTILFSLAFLAIVWSEQLHIESITPWPILFAALLGSIGINMIFGKKNKKWKKDYSGGNHYYSNNSSNEGKYFDENVNVEQDSGEVVTCESKFAGTVKYITSNNLKKVYVRNDFSGMSIYLDKAKVPSKRLEIEIKNSFGGVEIYIPANWIVENELNCSFGGYDEEGTKAPTDAESVKVVIKGSANLSGVTIKYI